MYWPICVVVSAGKHISFSLWTAVILCELAVKCLVKLVFNKIHNKNRGKCSLYHDNQRIWRSQGRCENESDLCSAHIDTCKYRFPKCVCVYVCPTTCLLLLFLTSILKQCNNSSGRLDPRWWFKTILVKPWCFIYCYCYKITKIPLPNLFHVLQTIKLDFDTVSFK